MVPVTVWQVILYNWFAQFCTTYLRLHFILRSFMPRIVLLLPAPSPVQLCAVFGTLVIPIAYMTVHELTRSCTAAFIASTLLICGECPPPTSTVGLPTEL